MPKRWLRLPAALVTLGAALTILTALLADGMSRSATLAFLTGAALSLASLPFLRRTVSDEEQALADEQQRLANRRAELDQVRSALDDWRAKVSEELDQRVARLESRERSLAERFAMHQELIEFPDSKGIAVDPVRQSRLAEADRRVLAMLEEEAERTYEKIRNNDYTTDGRVDLDRISADLTDLVTRVARVYSPESENPLLETSFEQLARAAGRICLHTLVIVEQLPLDVKQYNINTLHSYIRRAIVSYGAYQKAAPWLTYMSRGLYAGRFAAGSNPVTLGAWWLATEVGKRAGAKAISEFVDRQAITLLHELIRVVGFEVANIYGEDFRHRDPNWVYGAELTELLHRFPLSRDSLREALKQVSALPLRNEYDRIYLYRCIADHRSAGLKLSDPAVLTREEREKIARQLEHFFHEFIHGATDDVVEAWREEFEQRFDMKLSLAPPDATRAKPDPTPACVRSLCEFLVSVAGVSQDELEGALTGSHLFRRLDTESAARVRSGLQGEWPEEFRPPDLDPSDPLVDEFLADLARVTLRTRPQDESARQLLVQTGAYFRRTDDEMQRVVDAAMVEFATRHMDPDAPIKDLPPAIARRLIEELPPGTVAEFAYPEVARQYEGKLLEVPDAWLVGLSSSSGGELIVITPTTSAPLWSATEVTASRIRGWLIDDCRLPGGRWHTPDFGPDDPLVVIGSIRGGGYTKWFAPLLRRCISKDAAAEEEHSS